MFQFCLDKQDDSRSCSFGSGKCISNLLCTLVFNFQMLSEIWIKINLLFCTEKKNLLYELEKAVFIDYLGYRKNYRWMYRSLKFKQFCEYKFFFELDRYNHIKFYILETAVACLLSN
jgi:hypothetical protein